MANEWRDWLRLPDGSFAIPMRTISGVPGYATVATLPGHEADNYWNLREGWRTLGVEAFDALYAKWAPKRDAILGKEDGYLNKTRQDWERFYLALADERAAREYAQAKVSSSFGVDGRELLRVMGAGAAG